MIKKAFTVLELIVVMAIFMVLIGISVPPLVNYMFANQVEVAGQELTHVLRRAQSYAAMQIQDSSWTVALNAVDDKYTFDSTEYLLPGSVSFGTVSLNGGGSDLVFDQLTGETSTYGTVTLVGSNGDSFTVTINQIGNVLR